MSNQESSGQDVKQDITNADGVDNTAHETKVVSNDTIPRARLNEEIAKRKELDARLHEFEKAKEIEAQKKLEEEGNYNTVLSQKDAEIERLKPFEEELINWKKTAREEELSKLSEEDQEEFKDLPLKQLKKVTKRFAVENKSVSVDDSKPSTRQFAETDVRDFRNSTKGQSSKQRQASWTDFLNKRKS